MRPIRQVDARSVRSDFGSGVTREQYKELPAQCTERARVPVMLAGHDPLRVMRADYAWWRQR